MVDAPAMSAYQMLAFTVLLKSVQPANFPEKRSQCLVPIIITWLEISLAHHHSVPLPQADGIEGEK